MQTFEEFMEEKVKQDTINPPFIFTVWANQFKSTSEKIARVVHIGDSLSFNDIKYMYDDVSANILPIQEIDMMSTDYDYGFGDLD